MALQHAYIVVPNSYLIVHVDEEDVVDAWVLEVVQRGGNDAAHLLQAVQLESIFQAALVDEVIKCLANIRRVRLIVVSQTLVPSRQMPDKTEQFIKIDIVGAD